MNNDYIKDENEVPIKEEVTKSDPTSTNDLTNDEITVEDKTEAGSPSADHIADDVTASEDETTVADKAEAGSPSADHIADDVAASEDEMTVAERAEAGGPSADHIADDVAASEDEITVADKTEAGSPPADVISSHAAAHEDEITVADKAEAGSSPADVISDHTAHEAEMAVEDKAEERGSPADELSDDVATHEDEMTAAAEAAEGDATEAELPDHVAVHGEVSTSIAREINNFDATPELEPQSTSNNMPKLLLLLGAIVGIVILVFIGLTFLTSSDGIGRSMPLAPVAFYGDEYFITSDLGNITNQEAFDLMVESPQAIMVLLNLVDEVLLRGNFEIDYERPVEFLEDFKSNIPDFDEWMMQNGFASEADVIHVIELEELRQATARGIAEVTDEEIETAFERWYDPELVDLADKRDEIYDHLFRQAAQEITPAEVARLRYVTGLEIFNETLEAAYVHYLTMSLIPVTTHEASSQEATDVIAHINGVDITIGQFFAALSNFLGFHTILGQLDVPLIATNFSVDPAAVNERIDELREEFGDDFDDVVANAGFESEAELFEHFERIVLEEAVILEHRPPSEDDLRVHYAQMAPTVRGSHILVADEDVALDLIQQLKDADDFSETFAELAAEYSTCPSGSSGGDLGFWERGGMVAPFDDAVFGMEVGEFTDEPVVTQHGFHIIYKTDATDVPTFEEAHDELMRQELARLRQTGTFNEILMNYRQAAGFQFSNPTLQARFEFFVARAR